MFRRLGVFAGGFDRVAAVRVSQVKESDEIVSTLRDRSLLNAHLGEDATGRYVMLETVRDFAWDRILGAGEAGRMRDAHADWFLKVAEGAKHVLRGPEQTRRLQELDADIANMRSALGWLEQSGRIGEALPVSVALDAYLVTRGHFRVADRFKTYLRRHTT